MGDSLYILIVDDRPDTVLFLAEFLLSRNHQVETSASGGEALEAIIRRHRTSSAYDLLISDVSMPGMDGIALVKELRRRGILLPVALYTAYGAMHPNLAQEANQLNCLTVLDKPIELRRVEHLINDVRATRGGTSRHEKDEPFFGTSRVARPETESARRKNSTPGETPAPQNVGDALERRKRLSTPGSTTLPVAPIQVPQVPLMPQVPQAPMPPRHLSAIRTPLPFPVETPDPQTRSMPSFRTPVPQDPQHKDGTGRTINPKFRTPLPFLQGTPLPVAPPVIPPKLATAPPLRPPGYKTPLPSVPNTDQEQAFPTTTVVRRSVDPTIREHTGQIRRGTDIIANQNPRSPVNPGTTRIRRTVTGSYAPPQSSGNKTTPAGSSTRAVACAHCNKIFMVAIRPASFTSVCIHCGQLNRIDPL